MRPLCLLTRRFPTPPLSWHICRRQLVTLAIETSCDDTSVAVLEKHENNSATLHFHSKTTSDNREYGGVHPILSHESHQKHLARLVKQAIGSIQKQRKPDFVTVTRGPGMRSNLLTGIDTAKGLAVAWDVPLVGVNHMQAHALTPRMCSALAATTSASQQMLPSFPFLSLLVSGGHTMLVYSKDLCEHKIVASTSDIAIGDVLDKAARDILPPSIIDVSADVMYGKLLEPFAFPKDTKGDVQYNYTVSHTRKIEREEETLYGWKISSPYSNPGPAGIRSLDHTWTFSGFGSQAKRVVFSERKSKIDVEERRLLARDVMRVAFEHLISRVIAALQFGTPDLQEVKTIVVSGGVASNRYLKHILRAVLDAKGHEDVKTIFPPPMYCTDNAAMIAWTGLEMWEAGYRSELDITAQKKWSIDPDAEDGGILGVGGWIKDKIP